MNEKQTRKDQENPKGSSDHSALAAQECGMEEDKAQKDTDDSNQKKHNPLLFREWLVKWVPLFNAILAIFTIVYASVSIFQLRVLHQQAKTMNKQSEIMVSQLIIGQRAWFVVKGVNYEEVKVGQGVKILISVINSGNTPVLNGTIHSNMGFREKPVPVPMPFNVPTDAELSTIVVGPKSEMNHIIQAPVALTEEVVSLFDQKRIRLYAWGVIKYDDVFGRPHKTEFCVVSRVGTRQMDACQNNNTAD